MEEITLEEYNKASSIVRRFESQQDKTVEVTVTYNAMVSTTVKVPEDWNSKVIISALEDNYYDFRQDDEERVELEKLIELIVDGVDVKL